MLLFELIKCFNKLRSFILLISFSPYKNRLKTNSLVIIIDRSLFFSYINKELTDIANVGLALIRASLGNFLKQNLFNELHSLFRRLTLDNITNEPHDKKFSFRDRGQTQATLTE